MGLIKAFTGSITGTFADQWKEIVTAGNFDEHTLIAPGLLRGSNNGRGTNFNGSAGVISNGSKIFVPENTAAFIFSESGIEEIITEPGGYEYQNGEKSLFNGDSFTDSILNVAKDRFGYGGQTARQTTIAFVNLREIRGLKFGTPGPLVYNDSYYGTDLEIIARGTYSIRVVDPARFIRNFAPANSSHYSFDDPKSYQQLFSEFIQSFMVALNSLSATYRISQLPSQGNNIAKSITGDPDNATSWVQRFGLQIEHVGIETIEWAPDSRELVKQFSANKMNTMAYKDVNQQTGNIAAQQKVAQGIQDNGFGDGGAGMILGMNMAQAMGNPVNPAPSMSLDQQIDAVTKLKGLLDNGILTQEEFDKKKNEIMGL